MTEQQLVDKPAITVKSVKKMQHGLECPCEVCLEKTKLSHIYYKLKTSLYDVPVILRPFVLKWREKFNYTARPRIGANSKILDEISPWQSNAIRVLEDFDDGNHQ